MRKLVLVVIVVVAVAAALPAQNVNLSDFQTGFQNFATAVAGTLASTATIGLNWDQAYIGQFPHLGLGVTVGASLVPFSAIEPITSMMGVTLPAELQTYGAPIPAATLDARIGGFFLPFDIGLKFGTIPDQAKSLLGSIQLSYLMAGGDIRFALLKDHGFTPALSIGAGYTFFQGSIGVPGLIGAGASIDISQLMAPLYGPGTYTLNFSNPDLLFNWQSSVIEAKVELSKTLLFITPSIGFAADYGISSAGGGISSTVSANGATLAQVQQAFANAGYTAPTDQALTVSSSSSGWAFRAFGGLNIALFFLNVDATAFYNVLTGSYGGSVNLRFQI